MPAHLCGERAVLRDAEKTPIVIGDYSISATPRGVSVRIRQEVSRVLSAHFWELATRRREASDLEAELRREWDYLMFEPIQFQLKALISRINQKRRRKKLEPVSASWVRRYPTPAPHALAA